METLINLETAKLAKFKRFNIPTQNYFRVWYDEPQDRYNGEPYDFNSIPHSQNEQKYSRPTLSVVQQWFMKEHNIFVLPELDCTSYPKFAVEVWKFIEVGEFEKIHQPEWSLYRTYNEALEYGLTAAFKIL